MARIKKFQIGLVTGTTINWTKVPTTKIEKNGFGNDFIIGIGGNYMFNENVTTAMGLQFDMGNFTLNYGSDASTDLGDVYYAYEDTDILQYKSDDGGVQDLAAGDTSALAFQLLERTYRTKYITIPVFLKFQTGMLGKFRYYGKFGARMSILGSVRMDDFGRESTYWVTSQSFTTNSPTVEKTMTDLKPVGIRKNCHHSKWELVYMGVLNGILPEIHSFIWKQDLIMVLFLNYTLNQVTWLTKLKHLRVQEHTLIQTWILKIIHSTS